MKKTTVAKAETTILDTMLAEAATNETTKRTLTEAEAIKLVDQYYSEVASKNGMLKRLRAEGYSISMSRLFGIYETYANLISKTNPTTPKEA